MDQSQSVDAPITKRQKLSDDVPETGRCWIVTLDRDDDTYKSDREPDSIVEGRFQCEEDARRAVTLLMIRDIEQEWNYDWHNFGDLPTAESLAHCHHRHGIPSQAVLTAIYKFYLKESVVVMNRGFRAKNEGRVTVNRDNCWKVFHDEALSPDHWDFEGLFDLLYRGEFVPETRSYSISISDAVTDMPAWERKIEADREFAVVDESLDGESSDEEEEEEEGSEDKLASES
jgi:hypothetical protein